eukprot:scaffold134609_cov18-Tisochrysis_lutea.AAC.1
MTDVVVTNDNAVMGSMVVPKDNTVMEKVAAIPKGEPQTDVKTVAYGPLHNVNVPLLLGIY